MDSIFSNLFVFLLATFLGLEVIRRVSPLLHTPLMSLTNAISAISVVGAILILGEQVGDKANPWIILVGTLAVTASTINLVSGYLITDRMLKMFKTRAPNVPKGSAAVCVAIPAALFAAVEGGALHSSSWVAQVSYLVAAALFILALKWLSAPATARRGVLVGEIGMGLAVFGTLLLPEVQVYQWIFLGMAVGTAIGVPIALLMPMTAVPQRTALSHCFGGLAVGLIGSAKFYLWLDGDGGQLTHFKMAVIVFEVLLGMLTFTGSLMAFGKLQEILPTRPIVYKGQNVINLILLAVAVVAGVLVTVDWQAYAWAYPLLVALALLFGVLLIIPIGGADMPTVISLLNSYAGLAASAMGFVLDNQLLIVAGALDGSSGFILSIIMCRAMNRSFTNVLFGAFGQVQTSQAVAGEKRTVRSAGPEEAAQILEAANSVVIVPGYGMAVAQAQHKVRELYDALTKRGVTVRFAIHPVAGRMPGHMNVLLAEADIPYDSLMEMEEINPEMGQADVALIIGANDVTNPAAKTDKGSPIYGMPIIEVDKARTVMVIKRSMSAGFAGIDNPLYYLDKTLMLFGDAKAFVGNIGRELSGGH